MTYIPDEKRYDGASFNRCGRSGIVLPPISLGLWQNFGGVNVFGGGLALYDARGQLLGAIGVSGDSSCADHNIAWRTRNTQRDRRRERKPLILTWRWWREWHHAKGVRSMIVGQLR